MPESESEARAVVNSIKNNPKKWTGFFSIHSKGQWWLTPFGYTTDVLPPDNDDILAAANAGAEAIKNYNGKMYLIDHEKSYYKISPSSQRLYIHGWSVFNIAM